MWLALAAANAQEAQLADLANVLPNSPALIKSLGDAAEFLQRWKPAVDAEAWRKRRPEVERAFRSAIGLERLPERTPLNARIVNHHDLGSYTIENVIFESRPGFPVSANVYRAKPFAAGKHPAIVSPIGHFLSAGKTASEVQARCIKLAQMGFVVLVYDAIGQGERMTLGNIHHEAGYALLPLGETIAGWMVWDTMRAIDYVSTLAEVDAERIGVTGNSGGGLNTLFTAALDSRVHAAAVTGFTFEFANWLKYAGPHCTCTHLPGVFAAMEWFEIAGLIAPRPLLMLQGDRDNIFPISGARRAGRNAEAIYALLLQPANARFDEVAGQPHAYSRPYREHMYGWMARHLLRQGNGDPIAEGDIQPLPEKDPRLLCNLPDSPTVVDLAREKAMLAVAGLPVTGPRADVRPWVLRLTAPPEAQPQYLAPHGGAKTAVPGGSLEKISFVSEDGQHIPGLLWLPSPGAAPFPAVLIADERGKQAVAESDLVLPLLAAGFGVLAVDVRGRGETLGHYGPRYDTNFRLVANQILFGQPLAGRRAYDLTRAIDYLATRPEISSANVTIVGRGADALPVLLAAVADTRIAQIAAAGFLHSFVSQMRAKTPAPGTRLNISWNDAQLNGRLNAAGYSVDFGSVIPAALATADVPDIVALLAPRKVLFCQAGDTQLSDAAAAVARFERVTGTAGQNQLTYEPRRSLDGALLLQWIGKND
ncbi:MAG: acetylxylan esterase [Candidatus Solibacter usitatus]|nr:acetylxylan esterase [Candidatus Solibacter usitatus]